MGLSRAQAHTLEAIVASLLLLTGLTFALQTTAVTPLSASTASQHIENQQASQADGLLAAAAEEGALKRALLFYNDTAGRFHGADRGYYTGAGPPNEFGRMLNETFADRGRAFNVYLTYVTDGGTVRRDQSVAMVYMGQPSDNAVVARRTVTLYDDDRLFEPGSAQSVVRSDVTMNGTTSYPVPELSGNDGIYRVVHVEVVVWRM